jgi:hypothetical protein
MTDFDAIAQGMTQAVPFAGHLGLEITSAQRRDLLREDREGADRRDRDARRRQEALATLDAEGKVVFPCEVELNDSEGTRVASATVHWHVRLNRPASAEVAE